MIFHRKSKERGYFDHGWLKSHHTFSFAEYYDPKFMSFGPLRVINEDFIAGGAGFPTHGHRDMEIITYVISGAIEHKDSTGGHGIIRPGEIQTMTAGTGIRHSEFNHLQNEETHLLQIWVQPNKNGYKPGYDQRDFSSDLATGSAILIASPDTDKGSMPIHQDVKLYAKKFLKSETWGVSPATNRLYWLQVVNGSGAINDLQVAAGDGVALADTPELYISGNQGFEVLLFDMIKQK